MITLARTVRFCVNPPESRAGDHTGVNGYAGKPAMRGLGRYYELDITCRGEPDPGTGYLINIKDVDAAARGTIIPAIEQACDDRPGTDPAALLAELAPGLAEALAPVALVACRWKLTPTYSVETEMPDAAAMLIRQRFDFAAAHRLHVPGMSDDDNRALFGKCNNPSGHGHNYQVEPAVRITPGAAFDLATLERLTGEAVIDPFDHTHLNEDTPDFNTQSGVNPSVENIAKVFFDRLAPKITAAGAELATITVWETDRTSATYPA